MIYKSKIINELGINELLLPSLIDDALIANDRIKYFFTLIQIAKHRANDPTKEFSNLSHERQASGVDDRIFDTVIDQSIKIDDKHYQIANFELIVEQIFFCIDKMIVPLKIIEYKKESMSTIDNKEVKSSLTQNISIEGFPYSKRSEELRKKIGIKYKDNVVNVDDINVIVSGQREKEDSYHLLVMDLHKELNKLQLNISQELINGATVYGITKDDQGLVRAFMEGLASTEKLKFGHEGLGTTATRSGINLIIQNNIGETDVHILVIHVKGMTITLTYTDNHIQRLLFFQSLFEKYHVKWNSPTSNKKNNRKSYSLSDDTDNDIYNLCIGEYIAKDQQNLEQYLYFLGSRLVFLIDWNKARKCMKNFMKKTDCMNVLKW